MDFKNSEISKVRIAWIDDVFRPDEKKPFIKQTFCVEIETEINGDVNRNSVIMQVLGDAEKPSEDKTKMLDNINPGDLVDITYGIKSFPKKNIKKKPSAKNPDSFDGFTNVTATRITLVKAADTKPDVKMDDKMAAWNKLQEELKDPNIPHPGMKWDEEKKSWIDDLPF